MKNVPNIITICRIILSLLLPFSYNHLQVFLFIYIIGGLSDIADGFLARHFMLSSRTGALLDTIADFIFLSMSLVVVFLSGFYWSPSLVAFIVLIMLLKIVNLVYTRYKFKQWGIIHTIGNKLTGVILFVILPVAVISGDLPVIVIITIGVAGIYSAIDESLILIKSKVYDVNQKGSFSNFLN